MSSPIKPNQRFTSDVFWHFVGRSNKSEEDCYSILTKILQTELNVGKINEPFRYIKLFTPGSPPHIEWGELYGYPVNCLADIPFKDLAIHSDRYGKCAIGFHKTSAISHGFSPILYVNQLSGEFHNFIKLRDEIEDYLDNTNQEMSKKFLNLLLHLGSYAKTGLLNIPVALDPKADEAQINNYYYEREWRSTRSWNFAPADVAILILPNHLIKKFYADRKKLPFKVLDEIPVLSFDMIHAL